MGIYDRQYYREETRDGFWAERSMVFNLIFINVGIFLADAIFLDGKLSHWMALETDYFKHPWTVWELVTCGFAHEPHSVWHVGLNMIALYFFGRDVENIYGRNEFLKLYLSLIVLSGLVWLVAEQFSPSPSPGIYGASGAIMGIVLIYVLHYPRRMFYIYGVVPVPVWALASLYLIQDILGATNRADNKDHVAHIAHLAGAAFGYLYYRTRWQLFSWVPKRWSLSALKMRPKLRVHDPGEEPRDLQAQVDEILAKIHREGEASLTRQERDFLEEASRRYQRRKQ